MQFQNSYINYFLSIYNWIPRGGNSLLFARIKFNITKTFSTQFNEGKLILISECYENLVKFLALDS